ncbi:MAG: methylenetetrahydrofolate reductase [NAD(P)H] [Bacteroidetes bacterium]|nr:methylenetetrahydrofolate reductase [NAD(P)H] [Bacteroidota bacterium]HET6243753.1 methylenetetrahydrofolate reductase [NAD(P)H] [Bacteroidia bacterium]
MKVIDHIKQAEKTLFSFEILPPLKGKSIQSIYDGIDPLMEFKPSFINVTYHREEYVYKKREKGYLEKVSIRKRPGTVGICAAIINKYQADAVPHLICGGFTREETENALIDLHFLGIDNVLALRGDPIKTEPYFMPTERGHKYAIDIVKQIVDMNTGKYLDEELDLADPTDFCIGVAGYPEKHFEALNLKTDLLNLKRKVEAGADYIVTQMFFDNKKYFEFVENCRKMDINVPIIPALKPIVTLNHIAFLPKTFNIDFPEDLADELIKCRTDAEVKTLGIEWAVQQSKDLIAAGVPCIHYYTMGKSETVRNIASQVY